MRHLIAALAVLACASLAWGEATDAGKVTVHGTALRAGSWCGGAAPTPELMKSMYKARPTSERFQVLPGKTGSSAAPIVTFTPDAKGAFSISLPPGDYCLMEPGKTDKPKADYGKWVDAACMASWRKTCSVVWHIGPQDTDATFTLQERCFGPCYNGPLPPAAAPHR